MNYLFTEKQTLQSQRQGALIEEKSLTAAKRIASKMQFFQGTALTLQSTDGRLLAYKESGEWQPISENNEECF